ncbi:MAG: hypothetical protein JW808_11355 [Victivallales bacterium]|nr:hypothetical protein [Victivallales bacterium]
MDNTKHIDSGALRFRFSETSSNKFQLCDLRTGSRLICGEGTMLAPLINGRQIDLAPAHSEFRVDGSAVISSSGGGLVGKHTVEITPESGSGSFDISCEFTVTEDCQLNALAVLPENTILNLMELINFRNRHHTPRTWPELLLGDKNCETDTTSRDWQFAPHPTMMIFKKLDSIIFIGTLDMPRAFGFHIKAQHYRLCCFQLDYGSMPHGQPLTAGETFRSPRFRIFMRHGRSIYDVLDDFSSMLISNAVIPDPAKKNRCPWWTEPLYCTWIDQCFLSKASIPEELKDQNPEAAVTASNILTEAMVRDALAIIKRERLPFRTILIDEGWQIARGQWEPHSERFPDLRALVDDIHAADMKVVVWWNWAEIGKTAKVNPRHLAGGGRLNKHGCRMRDYSLGATQEEYLKPLFRKLFSDEPGCYNLDGVKTDFLADKVHPELPPANPEWRGEENYFLKVYELFYHEMKRWKPDAVHIGCAGNFHLAHLIDINRTYDVHSCNHLEHEERAKMLTHTSPGCPVAYDFHQYMENLEGYFTSARHLGASLEIGNIMMVKKDIISEPEHAANDYYAMLRLNFNKQCQI